MTSLQVISYSTSFLPLHGEWRTDSNRLCSFQAERSAGGQRPAGEGVREGAHGQGAQGRVQDGAAHRQGKF